MTFYTPRPSFGYYLVRHGTANLPPACPPDYIAVSGCLGKTVIPDCDNIPLYGTAFHPEPLAAKWDIPPGGRRPFPLQRAGDQITPRPSSRFSGKGVDGKRGGRLSENRDNTQKLRPGARLEAQRQSRSTATISGWLNQRGRGVLSRARPRETTRVVPAADTAAYLRGLSP